MAPTRSATRRRNRISGSRFPPRRPGRTTRRFASSCGPIFGGGRRGCGTKAVTFADVFVRLQIGGPALIKGPNRPVTFGGKTSVTVAPGSAVWSDGVQLGFVRDPAELAGRKLAISFHVAGESGPMTWHAKALTTSYATAPGAGS